MNAQNSKMNQVKTSSEPIQNTGLRPYLIPAFLGFALYLTIVKNDFFLEWAEKFSLFLPTSLFFSDCMKFVGGLLIYTGTFFTQFYYYPILGSFIFIALLLLIQYLTIIAFRIPQKYYPLSFIPAFMLLLSITQLGYVWLTLKSPGYLFSNTLGIFIFLLCFTGYKKLNNRILRSSAMLLIVAAGYPFFGFYALLTGLICIGYEIILFFRDRKRLHFLPIVAGLALISLVPQLYYDHVYNYMQHFHIYTAGLPRFAFTLKELRLWVPFIFLFLSYILFLSFELIKPKNLPTNKSRNTLPSGIFLLSILFTFLMSFHDESFKTEIKVNAAMENSDWKKVITLTREMNIQPTRNIVLNYQMALFMQGQPADKNFSLRNTKKPNCIRPVQPVLIQMSGRPLLYRTGRINDCYRWCMEDMVEYGMKTEYLKYMVKCAILNGEYALAQKYNSILLKTLFHKDWARKYQTFIENPNLAEADPEMKAIRYFETHEQGLDIDK